MVQRNPLQVLKEAKQIAQDHAMFVVERSGKFLLYRVGKPNNIYVGSRASVTGLRSFVARCAKFH